MRALPDLPSPNIVRWRHGLAATQASLQGSDEARMNMGHDERNAERALETEPVRSPLRDVN